jgi:Cytochrome c oxidase subunit III
VAYNHIDEFVNFFAWACSSFQQKEGAWILIILGFILLTFSVLGWIGDVITESIEEKKHTAIVSKGLRIGFILFLISEAIYLRVFLQHFFIWDYPCNGNRLSFPSKQLS